MSPARLPFAPLALLALGVWLCGAARPALAEEAATAIASPAARWGAMDACRIVAPTFEPTRPSRPDVTPTRYPGGAHLSRPVAAPCPGRTTARDV